MEESEIWYEVQFSRKNEDDWCATDNTFDTPEKARELGKFLKKTRTGRRDFRVVKIINAVEVVEVL